MIGPVIVVGNVDEVKEEIKNKKPPKVGTFKVYNIVLDSKLYGLGFNRKIVDDSGIKVGDRVKAVLVKNFLGYYQVDSLEKTTEAPTSAPVTGSSQVPSNTNNNAPTNKGDYSQIDRREAVKCAMELVSSFYGKKEKSAVSLANQFKQAVAIADHVTHYIQTGTVEINPEDLKKLAQEGV